jgi:hypothetical protein
MQVKGRNYSGLHSPDDALIERKYIESSFLLNKFIGLTRLSITKNKTKQKTRLTDSIYILADYTIIRS